MRFLHTLTTVVLIFSIYLLDFTPHASLMLEARAEEAASSNIATPNATATTNQQAQPVTQSEQEKIDEANGTKEKSVQKTGLSKDISDENFITNITAIAAAYATTTMIVACKPIATDMYVAAGAGAIWVAGEIMAAMKYSKSVKELEKNFMEEFSTKREDTEKQITSLMTLKKSYEDAKGVVESKLKMQKVALIAYAAAAVVAMASYLTFEWAKDMVTNCNSAPIEKLFSKNQNSNSKLIFITSLLSKYFLKDAHAASTPFWFLGGAGLALFKVTSLAQSEFVKTMVQSPVQRAALYGAFGLLMTMAISAGEKILKNIDGNIEKIDGMINRLKFLSKGGLANKMQEKEYQLFKKKLANQTYQVSTNPKETTICATSGTVGACSSTELKLASMPDFTSLPGGMQTLGTSLARVADSVGGKNSISGATLSSVDTLAGKSAALRKSLKNKERELISKDKKLVKSNIEGNARKIAAKLNAITRKKVAESGMTPMAANNAIGGYSSMMSGDGKAVADSDAKKGIDKTAGVVSTEAKADKTGDLDFNFNEEPTAGSEEIAGVAGTTSENLDEFETGALDVNSDSTKNIFDIISGRYFKSGFPRLLEEEL
ncbi:MAG: hypothetical protein L6Q33_00735 [Bacteriovoracaceae bacterium]|nr:hypothetical protein [Bacteriovoracaceae bacterium]